MKPVYWIIASIVLVTAEMILPGTYLLWIGAAAALTGIFAMIFADASLLYQSMAFAFFGVVLLYVAHKKKVGYREPRDNAHLNQKKNQLLGRTTVVPENFSVTNNYVWIDDCRWTVCSSSFGKIKAGARAQVMGFHQDELELSSKDE